MKENKHKINKISLDIDLHSLHPWGRGGRLLARKSRRAGAAPGPGRKQQEPPPLPRQRKSVASSATSSGACSVFKHGSKGEAKARKNHAAFLFPRNQIASGSGSLEGVRGAGCLCFEKLSV